MSKEILSDLSVKGTLSIPKTGGGEMNVQQEIEGKQATLTFDSTPTASSTNPVTSGGVKTALDTKQNNITGGATTITSSNLTASRALISDGSGKVSVSAVTSTELGYLDGVTSAVQTQLDIAVKKIGSQIMTGDLEINKVFPQMTLKATGASANFNFLTNSNNTTALLRNGIIDGTSFFVIRTFNPTTTEYAEIRLDSTDDGKLIGLAPQTNDPPTSIREIITSGYLDTRLSPLATDSAVVHKTGNESIAGIKTFSDNVEIGTTLVPKQLSIKGNLLIDGNITQNGSTYETHAQQVYTTDDKIIMRDGATAGLISGATSGLKFKKYDGTNDGELSVDSSGIARVGDVGDLQPLATRNEAGSMTDNQPVVWDSSGLKMVTRALVAGDIPALDAGKITTGAFADARIPNLGAEKITSGTFADARIPTSVERTANKRSTWQTTTTDTAYPSEKLVKTALDAKADTTALTAHTGNTSNPHGVTKAQVGLTNVANILQYSASNAPPYPVTSVAGKTGAVTLAEADIPALSAGKITSGTFADARIPALAISKITGLQTALDAKQATITGGATTIATSNLTASRALVSDASGKVAVSTATSTQLGHLVGVTSSIQTQLNGKQDTLTFDSTPTASSTNPVTSGGVKTALDGKVSKTGDESIGGVKTFTSTPVIYQSHGVLAVKSSGGMSDIQFYNRDSSNYNTFLRSQDDGATYAYSLLRTWNNRSGKLADLTVMVNDSEGGYVTATMRINPGNSDVITKGYLDTRLTSKQDNLTFDNVPTSGSSNPVKSGGVYNALAGKQTKGDGLHNAEASFFNGANINLLLIDVYNPTSPVNAVSHVGTEDASTLINSPISSGAFYAVRSVEYTSTHLNNTNIKVLVTLKETYPIPGRVWMNSYNTDSSWSGWKSHNTGGWVTTWARDDNPSAYPNGLKSGIHNKSLFGGAITPSQKFRVLFYDIRTDMFSVVHCCSTGSNRVFSGPIVSTAEYMNNQTAWFNAFHFENNGNDVYLQMKAVEVNQQFAWREENSQAIWKIEKWVD